MRRVQAGVAARRLDATVVAVAGAEQLAAGQGRSGEEKNI